MKELRAPFPYFGGKRDVTKEIWSRLGRPRQYIEPFCGSAALLLAAPSPASLEVVNDINGFIANFWRATKCQPAEVAWWADYPVSHIDMSAAHVWLMNQRERIAKELHDIEWPGDAKVAGRWLYGQCCWIGSGWCDWTGKVPHVGNAGRGIQAAGQVPHVGNAGMGIQAAGQVPHVGNAGMGDPSGGTSPPCRQRGDGRSYWTSGGETAHRWLTRLADRLERVRVVHGDWSRCLNHHYGGRDTAVVLDPPYDGYEGLYRADSVAAEVVAWCRENSELRIALCGHRGDYDLPDWDVVEWERKRLTYSGGDTKAEEAIWYSPACLPAVAPQGSLFGFGGAA